MQNSVAWNTNVDFLCPSAREMVMKKGQQLLAKRELMSDLRKEAASLPERSLLHESMIAHCAMEAQAIRDSIEQYLAPNG